MRLAMWMLMASVPMLVACSKPEAVRIQLQDDGRPEVIWKGSSAMGLYVTSPDAQLPSGPEDKVKGGHVYWVVEATTFPTGFDSPVKYQQIPSGGKDATEKHGGVAGGEALMPGVQYKFGVVSLGGQMSVEEQW